MRKLEEFWFKCFSESAAVTNVGWVRYIVVCVMAIPAIIGISKNLILGGSAGIGWMFIYFGILGLFGLVWIVIRFYHYWRIKHEGDLISLKNGDFIRITYLPPCKNGYGTPNPYIGMEGEVWDLDGYTFNLQCETSWLTNIDFKFCKYEMIYKN